MEKGRLMMIIIIVLLVLLLGTVTAVSIYVLNLINTNNQAIADGSAAITEQKTLDINDMTEVLIGEITTNLRPGADGKEHSVMIEVNLRYDKTDEEQATAFSELLAANMNVARWIALSSISDRTKEDIDDIDRLAMLGDEIKDKLQVEFKSQLIQDVYFSDKYVQ
jgi:flagellar basal body-associated protein FliL